MEGDCTTQRLTIDITHDNHHVEDAMAFIFTPIVPRAEICYFLCKDLLCSVS